MVSTRERRRKIRHDGGPDYHDVKARKTGLFVGATRVDIGVLSDGEWLSFDAERALKLSGHARLHHCACGAWFIDHWAAKTCLACRKATILARARAYTAERAANRKRARKNRKGRCYHCRKPMPVERGTRRYCSSACRQAAYRERQHR